MGDQLTLDVVTRPAGGVVGSRRALSAVRKARPPGMRQLLTFGTADFSTRPFPPRVKLRRLAMVTIWESEADVDERWTNALADICRGPEHWHVRGELTRASFSAPWRDWTPDTDGVEPMASDEPALILISGQLKARHLPTFMNDGAKAVGHAFAQPGYLGGLGINNSPMNTTSCSAWRNYEDARAYAFKPGAHLDAMRRDRAGNHHTTEWFLRIRPLAERGTLAGREVFGGLLSPVAVAD